MDELLELEFEELLELEFEELLEFEFEELLELEFDELFELEFEELLELELPANCRSFSAESADACRSSAAPGVSWGRLSRAWTVPAAAAAIRPAAAVTSHVILRMLILLADRSEPMPGRDPGWAATNSWARSLSGSCDSTQRR